MRRRRGFESGLEGAQAPDRAEVVDPDQLLDPLGWQFEVVAASRDAGVVDEEPDLRVALANRSGHPVDRVPVAYVTRLVLARDLPGGRAQLLLAPADEDAQPVALGQPASDGGADAGPAAGDDRHAQGGPQ